ncbi:LysR family transcriptional regulator YnfL [[Actinomadura] parvosata subsp. kistnae]|uniref:LysR family transcriptional regulator n=2 Tax=Nonomuraea TaxID=83681 RepID=A0A1V0A8N7_9ACTN|nr:MULTISPECIES: LysR substrate-binding domain-containing protein [unclassified Nonomuraea]AQZ66561.1 LysR family transcriptional regulator [Nonomuraea sp. ATCC 55076]NJP93289.1 LysR family transcriptional regulator [Nonomuraea sp. FMUSA5-5]SPL95365.1 LysR family transcriptional regulator YnfL [Actinomadura parvosata subsp. kistnae]
MDLVRHLRYFIVVAEELHFGNAAIRLGMAQPPLSQRIKRLEEELGVRLFDRSARQVRLTEPGRLLLSEAREIVGRVDRLHELARQGGRGTVLRVGVPPDLAATVLAALVAAFRESSPEVRLAPAEVWTADQVTALAEGTIDVGLVRHPVAAPGLTFGQVLVQAQGVLLAESDPLAGVGEVHLADLAGRELLMPPKEGEPGWRAEVLTECRRQGFVPAQVHEGAGLGLVLAGAAVAFGPRMELPGLAWRPLLGSPITSRVSTAWRAATPAVGDFSAAAARTLKESAGMTDEGAAPVRRVSRRPGMLA